MVSFSLFVLSALVIVTMLLAKRMEEREKTPAFFLKLISHSDERARELHIQTFHHYSVGKEKMYFWIRNQLPLRAKNWLNKSISYIQEILNKYAGNIRNSHLLKRSDGISEFFKSIADIEKGNGKINETYEERRALIVSEMIEESSPVRTPKKKTANPRKRKITVIESE
ncbi:MAG: FAD-binding oxidoreductase [Candidatus Zambryskibacteria bacterium]|nr:FAD-binding oxidoreductase [Candidatus Zambryskibacteria bacterium]